MTAPQAYRGQRLGLPEAGPGSIATVGPRVGAFVVDAVASAVVAGLIVTTRGGHGTDRLPGSWSLIPFAIDYLLGLLVSGRTLGMYLFGLRLVRVDRNEPVGPTRAVARTVLLLLLVPAVIFDKDGRGLHDRLTDTAVVRG